MVATQAPLTYEAFNIANRIDGHDRGHSTCLLAEVPPSPHDDDRRDRRLPL